MLTNRYINGVPSDSRAAKEHGYLQKEAVYQRIESIKSLSQIAAQRGQSLSQMALAWVLRHPAVTSALIGAPSVKQLEENVVCLKRLSFTQDELDAIDLACK